MPEIEDGVAQTCSDGVIMLRRQPLSLLSGYLSGDEILRISATQYLAEYDVVTEYDEEKGVILDKERRERAIVGMSQASIGEALMRTKCYPGEPDRFLLQLQRSGLFSRNIGTQKSPIYARTEGFPSQLDPNHIFLKPSVYMKARRQSRRGRTVWSVEYSGRYWQTDDIVSA